MELRLKSFCQTSHGPELIDLFGYCCKGMPSLEVLLHARTSRVLKEKIIFLTKSRKMRLPPRRYILCTDIDGIRYSQNDLNDFELPFLILFWSMAEALPIKKLDDCVCSGKIQINGLITSRKLGPEHLHCLSRAKEKLKIIGSERQNLYPFPTISLDGLFTGIHNIRVQS